MGRPLFDFCINNNNTILVSIFRFLFLIITEFHREMLSTLHISITRNEGKYILFRSLVMTYDIPSAVPPQNHLQNSHEVVDKTYDIRRRVMYSTYSLFYLFHKCVCS